MSKVEEEVVVGYCGGHGKKTPGKRDPDGIREWVYNNVVVSALESYLKKFSNIRLVRLDDRTGETDVLLIDRSNRANKEKCDILIDVHCNASRGVWGSHGGTETFVMTPLSSNPKSAKLAKCIHPRVVKKAGLRDRGIKAGNLHMLRETNMPAVLIEIGFMDSKTDIKVLRDTDLMKEIGIEIARGILEYFGIKDESAPIRPVVKKPVAKPVKKPVLTKPTANLKAGEYKVAKGDTLWALARKFGMSVSELKKLNNLKSDELRVGQLLKVRDISVVHTVKSGDTLWDLSRRYGVSVIDIKRLNNLKSDVLSIGQRLKIK